MRHFCQVSDDRPALEILAEGDGQRRTNIQKFARLDKLTERDDLRSRVRHLYSNSAPSRNRRHDADALRAHRQREIIGEIGDLTNLHTSGGCHLELGDDGAGRATDELTLDTESAQRVHQLDAHRVQLPLADIGVARWRRGQQLGRRQVFVGE